MIYNTSHPVNRDFFNFTELIGHQCVSVLFDGLRPSVKA